ncbi:kelch repeat protein [Stylonychia lemnae]|uniref:Kelch repeat protein n=1 Tax=Stylonychia lemnae TaxID=5949 RepID=A0A078ANI0_STYLE|nr:kelch repeat protein [Stylonychia lemnae]|eukprot:CDW83734.1 kelch repeat protein [Stylonychia lemnae]
MNDQQLGYQICNEEWSEDQEEDPNNPHIQRTSYSRSVVINDRIYIFTNLSENISSPLKIIDLNLKRLFPIQFKKFGPTTTRINYSISNYKHKVYFYGGLNENSKILETMDEFDATTYKFQQVKYRLDFKPKGRQAHCSIAIDQYNMFIIGGSYSDNLIDPQPIPADEMILNFDMDASTFQQITIKPTETSDAIPNNLVYHSVFRLDAINLGILWYEYEAINNQDENKRRLMRSTIYNITKYTWRDINLIGNDLPIFRFGHSILTYYSKERLADRILILGGIDYSDPTNKQNEFVVQDLDFQLSQKFEQSGSGSLSTEKKQSNLKQFAEDSELSEQQSSQNAGGTSGAKKKKNKKKSSQNTGIQD